jgi:hypothetical protein
MLTVRTWLKYITLLLAGLEALLWLTPFVYDFLRGHLKFDQSGWVTALVHIYSEGLAMTIVPWTLVPVAVFWALVALLCIDVKTLGQ